MKNLLDISCTSEESTRRNLQTTNVFATAVRFALKHSGSFKHGKGVCLDY